MNTPSKLALLALGASLSLLGCDERKPSGTTTPTGSSSSSSSTTTTTNRTNTSVPGPMPDRPANEQPDNTAKNHPDKATSDKTPLDQSNSQSDITITASIRQDIMKADNMSTNAQNCKIITNAGVVTLRGPVSSQAEKDAIEAFAKKTSGVTRVDNLLEVKTTP